MKLLKVYKRYDLIPKRGQGAWLWDEQDRKYLDCYGGHAVISIGHSHPRYVERLGRQLKNLGFYSNSVINPLQQELAELLGRLSNCADYDLFLCNSGAEANENALKVASFHTGRAPILALRKGFHGRTSAAVAATDTAGIQAPLNRQHQVDLIDSGDVAALKQRLESRHYCALILEAVQGVGGLDQATPEFLREAEKLCQSTGTLLIADEVQSGFGRTGDFFAFHEAGITPDLISMAKGMGNGFPVGGILVRQGIEVEQGSLGTTFGGNHLACTAVLAVLETIADEALLQNARQMGSYLADRCASLPGIKQVKGRGLMLGLEFETAAAPLRASLIRHERIITGGSANPNLLRILPPLNLTRSEADYLLDGLSCALQRELHLKAPGR